MFKNRALQVRLVKPEKNFPAEHAEKRLDLDLTKINTVLLDQTKNVAKLALAGAVLLKVTDAACTIAVNYAPKN